MAKPKTTTILTDNMKRHIRSAMETFIATFILSIAVSIDSGASLSTVFSSASLLATATASIRAVLKITRETMLKNI